MSDKELYRYWKKYIDRNLYRVVSSEYLSDIRKNGLNPKKDPYRKIIPEIKKLFQLVLKLEKNGFIHEQDWGLKNKVTGKYIIMVSTEDIDSPFVDFTPRYRETHYYRKHNGGALTQTIKKITTDILERKPILSSAERVLVNRLNLWARKKSQFSNKTLLVKGSSKSFETALFQNKLGKKGDKYWKSPFGRFEHFKRIVQRYGLKKYEDHLKGKRLFYLRIKDKIPAKEIL